MRQPRFRWLSPRTFIALVGPSCWHLWVSVPTGNFGNHNKTYGTIGGVVIMLLWLWILNVSMLF
ncbi:YhjD/YihY/BrkB family envelope integrity protein [Pseudarthrobacter sp. lyk4-40-TYG-27]|uniref:YhjD/YihY/BrkB family envelope integrity protein n=1 Tax=Pseudarthrobacter sp. lyk4-40-TYG-27 TaxID=3040305 RepID=UPI00330625BD